MAQDYLIPGLDKWTKPNVRKIFLPDPNHVLFEIDLKQSDAQVVAWDSEEAASKMDFYKPDVTLKQIFREGLDLHTENAKLIYGLRGAPTNHQRQMAKHGVHATDFLAHFKTMAKKLDMTVHQAQNFQKRWFDIHPNIKKWHTSIEQGLMRNRTVTNRFGYRRIFFDRIESILPEAVAFIPQSTTVNVIDKILNRMAGDPLRGVTGEVPEAEPLLQVHDSIVGQFLCDLWPTLVPRLRECTKIVVPYSDPLIIGTDFSASTISWGHVKKFAWSAWTATEAPALAA